jgi:hypothetical protein
MAVFVEWVCGCRGQLYFFLIPLEGKYGFADK